MSLLATRLQTESPLHSERVIIAYSRIRGKLSVSQVRGLFDF
jgi:hypothetical protein